SRYICKACLASLQPSGPRPWITRQPSRPSSSSSRRLPPPPPPRSQNTQDIPDPADLERILLEEYERGPEIPSSSTDLDIKYFNAEPDGKLTRLKDNDDFDVAASGLDDEVKRAITHLENEMMKMGRMLKSIE